PHSRFIVRQKRQVRQFLDSIRTSEVPDTVWKALEELGVETVEPDVFRVSSVKQNRRIEYLNNVRRLTNAGIQPETDEARLLVTDRDATLIARIGYLSTMIFAVASTFLFFYLR